MDLRRCGWIRAEVRVRVKVINRFPFSRILNSSLSLIRAVEISLSFVSVVCSFGSSQWTVSVIACKANYTSLLKDATKLRLENLGTEDGTDGVRL